MRVRVFGYFALWEELIMVRKRYTPEQIMAKFRGADVRLAAGEKTKAICR